MILSADIVIIISNSLLGNNKALACSSCGHFTLTQSIWMSVCGNGEVEIPVMAWLLMWPIVTDGENFLKGD